jgi:hypothetical protein
MRIIKCKNCNEKIIATSNRQIYCIKCYKENLKEHEKQRYYNPKRKKWYLSFARKRKLDKTLLEKKRKRDREYYKKNKERMKKYQRDYNKKNPEKKLMQHYAYRFLKDLIYKRANGKCEYCGGVENLNLHHLEYSQKNKKEFRSEDIKKIKLVDRSCHSFLHNRGEIFLINLLKKENKYIGEN